MLWLPFRYIHATSTSILLPDILSYQASGSVRIQLAQQQAEATAKARDEEAKKRDEDTKARDEVIVVFHQTNLIQLIPYTEET